jgi:hypothetical protein
VLWPFLQYLKLGDIRKMLPARIFALILGIAILITTGVQSQSLNGAAEKPADGGKQPAVETPQTPSPPDKHGNPETRQAASLPAFMSLTEFSATMVGSMMGNIDETKVYRSGNLMRTEMPNMPLYYVTDLSAGGTYAVFPRKCGYSEAKLTYTFPFTFFRLDMKFERTPLGEEVVDGHHCHVERIVRTSEGGSVAKVKFWEADDLKGFPVKVEIEGGPRVITITYKNVKLERPDPAVFKHVANCGATPAPHR